MKRRISQLRAILRPEDGHSYALGGSGLLTIVVVVILLIVIF